MQSNSIYDLAYRAEDRFNSSILNRNIRKSFIARELVSRIQAVASPLFFTMTLALKVAGATLQIARTRNWEVVKDSLKTLSLSFAGIFLSIPVGLYSPAKLGLFLTPQAKPPVIPHQAIATHALASMTDEQMDKNWQLNKIFGTVRYINLDGLPQRLPDLKANLASIGLTEDQYQRYSGCIGMNLPKETYDRMRSNYKRIDTRTEEGRKKLDRQHMGQTGCYMSHYGVIKETATHYNTALKKLEALPITASVAEREKAEAEVKKYSSVLVMEDDNRFGRILPKDIKEFEGKGRVYSDTLTQKGCGRIFYEMMKNLPVHWDMLQFIAISYKKPEETVFPHLSQLQNSVSLVAYAVSAHMYPKILGQLEKIETTTRKIDPVDEEICRLQSTSSCYVVSPALAAQGSDSIINSEGVDANPNRTYWQADPSFV